MADAKATAHPGSPPTVLPTHEVRDLAFDFRAGRPIALSPQRIALPTAGAVERVVLGVYADGAARR